MVYEVAAVERKEVGEGVERERERKFDLV